jgi:hypothetical protein
MLQLPSGLGSIEDEIRKLELKRTHASLPALKL